METLAIQPELLANKEWQVSKLVWEKCGVFGDSFGALTAFFSALAFCGALIALVGQYWQLKRDTEVKTREHFPLLVLTPKEGEISFFVDTKGIPSLNLRVTIHEKNASMDMAFAVAHKMQVKIDMPKSYVWKRRVNIMNHVEGTTTIKRTDSLFIFGVDMEAFISALVSKNMDDQPTLEFSVAYRNFFGTYGKVSSVYRILLHESATVKSSIFTLLDLLSARKIKAKSDIYKLFGGSRNIAFKLREIPSKSSIGEITVEEYDEYVE